MMMMTTSSSKTKKMTTASGTGRNAVFMLRKKKRKDPNDIKMMSVSELKKYIRKKGLSLSGCISVDDLRKRAASEKQEESFIQSPSSNEKKISGLVGLRNIGNTCFMNACLQCLSNVRSLRESLLLQKSEDIKKLINPNSMTKGNLATTLLDLFRKMWTGPAHSSETPSKLKALVGKIADRFLTYHQQDAQEFMMYLLDGLHEDLNRVHIKPEYEDIEDQREGESDEELGNRWWGHYEKRNDSVIKDMFAGQLRSELTCLSCGHRSLRFDPFWSLSVPIPAAATSNNKDSSSPTSRMKRYLGLKRRNKCDESKYKIQECLKCFVSEERLDESEAPHCSKCKKSCPAKKRMQIFRLPKILVLHLKRFSETSRLRRCKLNASVECPIFSLDMSPYCT